VSLENLLSTLNAVLGMFNAQYRHLFLKITFPDRKYGETLYQNILKVVKFTNIMNVVAVKCFQRI
jgi:hypothetical protein